MLSGSFPSKGRDEGGNGELDTQDVGKGRRIEAEKIVGGGLESSVERESGHAGRVDTGAGVESFLFDDVEEWESAGDKMGHCTGRDSRGRSREPRRALTSNKTTRRAATLTTLKTLTALTTTHDP